MTGFFLRCFRDSIRVLRFENRVPETRKSAPRIGEIESLQVHTGYLTFSLKKNLPQGVYLPPVENPCLRCLIIKYLFF